MKGLRSIVTGLVSMAATIALAPPAVGQDVVSAMAGFVHFAKGRVLLDGEPIEFNEAELLHAGSGQRLRTADGWVEVMIMPGSFIRLAPGSELEIVRAGMLAAHMRLIEGAAAVDLSGAAETDEITVDMGVARVRFVKSGLYRLDFPAGGKPIVRVNRGKGRVELHGEEFDVGGKRQLTISPSDGKLKAMKLAKMDEDDLDRWSTERRMLLTAKAREQNRERDTGSDPLEKSEVYRCRFMGRRCPAQFRPSSSPSTWPTIGPFARFQGDSP